jgi:hypothetical protein
MMSGMPDLGLIAAAAVPALSDDAPSFRTTMPLLQRPTPSARIRQGSER